MQSTTSIRHRVANLPLNRPSDRFCNVKSKPLRIRHHASLQYIVQSTCPALLSSELRDRFAVTLLAVATNRLGYLIPIPALDAAMKKTLSPHSELTTLLAGEGNIIGNVFLLSIGPLMSAYLAVALLQFIPTVRQHFNTLNEEGKVGAETIQTYINYIFLFVAVVEAYMASRQVVGVFKQLHTMIVLIAGASICKYLTGMVTAWGISDGVGLFIGLGIATSYWHHLSIFIPWLLANPPPVVNSLLCAGGCFVLVACAVAMQGVEKRLPMTFYTARQSRGVVESPAFAMISERGEHRTRQHELPLPLSPNGARQLLFVNFYISILNAVLAWMGISVSLNNPWVFAVLVIALETIGTFADTTPRQLSAYLAVSNAGIRGFSPGLETETLLIRLKTRLKFVNAVLLAVLSLLAHGMDWVSVQLLGGKIGCLNILLLASTVLSSSRQVDALGRAPGIQSYIDNQKRRLGTPD